MGELRQVVLRRRWNARLRRAAEPPAQSEYGQQNHGTGAEQGDIVAQTEAILEGLKGALEAEGGSLRYVIRVTVYVTELDRLMDVHEVRHRYFGDALPASTLVQVAALVRPELMIEIEAIARFTS